MAELPNNKTDLEQQYISLLEQRVAQLEAAVKDGVVSAAKRQSNSDSIESSTEPKSSSDHDEKDAESKPHNLVRVIASHWDAVKRERIDHDETDAIQKPKEEKHHLTFRKIASESSTDYKLVDTDKSSKFRALLKQTFRGYPNLNLAADVVQMRKPFYAFVHKWTELENATAAESGDDEEMTKAREQLRVVMNLIQSSDSLVTYFTLRQSHLSSEIVSFETLWALFVPGSMIVAQPFMNKHQLFEVISGPEDVTQETKLARLLVQCFGYDFDGTKFVKVSYDIPIEKFRGTKSIRDLACYPVEYALGGAESLKQKLLIQGLQLFSTVRGLPVEDFPVKGRQGAKQMRLYEGDVVVENRNGIKVDSDSSTWDALKKSYIRDWAREQLADGNMLDKKSKQNMEIKGKIIIDHGAFLKFNSGNIVLGDLEAYDAAVAEFDENTEKQVIRAIQAGSTHDSVLAADVARFLQLLPPRHLGYSPKEKVWAQLHVGAIQGLAQVKKDLFEKDLQLDDERKRLIMALVETHVGSGRSQIQDTVAQAGFSNKGKGLVLLFHGAPGVGKTMTAESIAEATGKPLLVVSVAEIGLTPETAEANLEQMFELAASWQAILLVDEADVFLEARSTQGSPKRNALVSVLLRVLEYYEGIIILTTNRIKAVDVAVLSRIHLAIQYDRLTPVQRQDIFKQYLDQLQFERPSSIEDRETIDGWVEDSGRTEDLNGRQIRNLVQAAFASARERDPSARLAKKDLIKVKGIYRSFIDGLHTSVQSFAMQQASGGKN